MLQLLEFLGLAYWVEIKTDSPACTYYFGPFSNQQEAQEASYGYVEDLKEEEATGITVTIARMKPKDLTIFEDELGEMNGHKRFPALSGQLS
ncbi:DUF1816 domain-containing protein [Spirulina sp. CS-785/01]|uniref:DUF1816 domain-containing protein n=1 Tax=Spirulina sp. CS-785/01 TaxID=3021716 RepID=UPI00232F1A52|nr:DUF1816 domain-containing protein [Spirulina sp. CS-785/01]MDB9313438.1 DUF1816 domain-containing protein [Spirulina sp. CS-785/01]